MSHIYFEKKSKLSHCYKEMDMYKYNIYKVNNEGDRKCKQYILYSYIRRGVELKFE